jgi:hypothetical protein
VKTPRPDNSDYERLRDKYVRELDPHRAAMYLERMLQYVPTATELVQADFDRVLDGQDWHRPLPLAVPDRRRCGCPKAQHIWLYGHMQACGRPSPWSVPFRSAAALGRRVVYAVWLAGRRPSPGARDLACAIGEILGIMAVLLSVAALGGVMVWSIVGSCYGH